MPEGIKNKVAIIGMGCTKFGELWDKSAEDLMVDAFKEALEDAGIEKLGFWPNVPALKDRFDSLKSSFTIYLGILLAGL